MVEIIERLNDFVVFINSYPYHRTELWNKEKGVKRIYGRDGLKEKINYVIYPKEHYTWDYMKNIILPKYDHCPMCNIGKTINDKNNSSFKYNKINKLIYRNNKNKSDHMVNWNSVKTGLKQYFGNPQFLGQGLAQIPKGIISLTTNELLNKVINGAVGLVGSIGTELAPIPNTGDKKYKDLLRALFLNMMFTATDPTVNQLREIKRNADDLMAGLKSKNFQSAFSSMLTEPHEIVSAVQDLIPKFKFGNVGASFKKLGSLVGGKKYLTTDKSIAEIGPEMIESYSQGSGGNAFTDTLDDDDLVSY